MPDKILPVVILGGYLGVGKTTLLNRLLQERHGLRLAVLVNDFGAVNVDAALVSGSAGETIALTNGCICCSMVDGFLKVMHRLSEQAGELDGVVVEASGVADPAQTAAYATLPGFRPAAIIVLADAERVQKQARDGLIGRSVSRQLKAADMIVVTKGDLAGAERTAAAAAWIKATLPDTRVIATPAWQAPISLLFDALASTSADSLPIQPDRQTHQADGMPGHEEREEREDHGGMYERATAAPQRAVSERELRQWYAALPDAVLRVKGWVLLSDFGGAPAVVQGVGRRLELTPATQGVFPGEAMLVMLGLSGSLAGVVAPDGSPLIAIG